MKLQFLLARHGFPSGRFDGGLGERTSAALRRFQRWARIGADGIAGRATLSRLRRRPPGVPGALARPVPGGIGDGFGPRGDRFHAGVDFPAAHGTTVRAARGGVVTSAGWRDGGFGRTVSIAHGGGLRTVYAHLSSIHVSGGERVARGEAVGRVGATGSATGPHLHFEARVRGASIDPFYRQAVRHDSSQGGRIIL
ncbi:MAG: peptidoglycan DD-metalloendopeptidase family protein [Thermoleophilaceae bacterium]